MRRSYIIPTRWMVIYECEVPGGALNLISTKLPRPWSPLESSPSRRNPHGRTGNRTRDLMISIQKLWPQDQDAGRRSEVLVIFFEVTHNKHKATVKDSDMTVWAWFWAFLLCGMHHVKFSVYFVCFFVAIILLLLSLGILLWLGWSFLFCWNVKFWVKFIYVDPIYR
jgi:hypothetical protein